MISVYEHPPAEFSEIIARIFQANLPDVRKFVNACAAELEKSGVEQKESAEFEELRKKYLLHESPSRGFLLPVAQDLRPRLESLSK
jgi:hypothetical protein